MKFHTIPILILFLCGLMSATYAEVRYTTELTVEDLDMGNMLTWITVTEVNNKSFDIEKSNDGITFFSIGKIRGAMNSKEEKAYNFMDVSAGQGISYYRLRAIDTEGNVSYSKVASVTKETANNFTVIAMSPPNDVDNLFEVTINALTEEELNYKVFDMQGNVVYAQKQKLKKGINIITVDLSEISGESEMGFAGNNELLGDKVGYRVSLEGLNEAEMLTIAPRNKDIKTDIVRKVGN